MNFTDINRSLNERITKSIDEFLKQSNLTQMQVNANDPRIVNIIAQETYNFRAEKMNSLSNFTKRNIICYFSTWVQKPISNPDFAINDNDINGFMNAIQGMDKSKGLDLLLQTPGGSVTATESIVVYLKKMFNNDIRVIVPHLAMSAGTMIACASKEILMGKQSSLGPIDPQYKNVPTQGVIKEFKKAFKEVLRDPNRSLIWKEIIKQYRPTFVGECENIVDMADTIVRKWLKDNMLCNEANSDEIIERIMKEISDHDASKVHDRHYDCEKCKDLGLNIIAIESNQMLQDLVLELYHSYISSTYILRTAIKFIESNNDRTFVINSI